MVTGLQLQLQLYILLFFSELSNFDDNFLVMFEVKRKYL